MVAFDTNANSLSIGKVMALRFDIFNLKQTQTKKQKSTEMRYSTHNGQLRNDHTQRDSPDDIEEG